MRIIPILTLFAACAWGAYADNDGVIQATRLNLRSEPNTRSSVVGKLTKNEKVTVLRAGNGWLEIKTAEGKTGYVAASYVKASTAGLPALKESPKDSDTKADPAPARKSPTAKDDTPPFKDLAVIEKSARDVTVSGLLYPLQGSDVTGQVKFVLLANRGNRYEPIYYVHTGGSGAFSKFANKDVKLVGTSYRVENWKTPVMKVRKITPLQAK